MEDLTFAELLRRVRGGDQTAAAELFRQYEPSIRRFVRMKLTDPRIRRAHDSGDVCQSVLANFFTHVERFDLDAPEQLHRLLVRMAHNKLLDLVDHEQAACRGGRLVHADGGLALEAVADRQATPSAVVAGRELLEQARALFTEDECYLVDQRERGRDWADLAAELGTTPDALRMKHLRARQRVARQMGLNEVPHE